MFDVNKGNFRSNFPFSTLVARMQYVHYSENVHIDDKCCGSGSRILHQFEYGSHPRDMKI